MKHPRGGGGCPAGQSDKKKLTFFCFLFFFSAYFTEVKWSISKKSIIFQGSRGVQHFPGGVQLFPGGSNCLFSIETHITCDFPGGVRTPCPPPSGSALAKTTSFVDLLCFFLSCACYAFVYVCLLVPCCHLLGKG